MSIYFRGDNREPNGPNGIFLYGFERRSAGMSQKQLDNQLGSGDLTASTKLKKGLRDDPGDMHPWAAVCMTTRLLVTPLFPISNEDDRWIYAFYLDDAFIKDSTRYNQYVDTHDWQEKKRPRLAAVRVGRGHGLHRSARHHRGGQGDDYAYRGNAGQVPDHEHLFQHILQGEFSDQIEGDERTPVVLPDSHQRLGRDDPHPNDDKFRK